MQHPNHVVLFFYRIEVMADKSFTLQEKGFSTFVALVCDFDLDPMTFIYEVDPYSLEIYRMCQNELRTSKFSYIRSC